MGNETSIGDKNVSLLRPGPGLEIESNLSVLLLLIHEYLVQSPILVLELKRFKRRLERSDILKSRFISTDICSDRRMLASGCNVSGEVVGVVITTDLILKDCGGKGANEGTSYKLVALVGFDSTSESR
ncbi:hypothetical protein O6H91_22G020900 [Diphasiastrum complanatum]|uniref:Uncharacterized protein n=1 Tax=Diphasiastrum complanatum TaxID=34168 RepID=A0ACC2ADK0_DIPCM|nr:hypothetical protein O6H91_22G020900 [Diphasiastrum complanatum]